MKLIWYLLCYSLLGFVGEVLYARLTHSAKPDRKCRLFLPLCPVYGIGAVVIALLPFRSPISVFLTAAAVATGVEYLCSVFYEKAWGVNVNGRVCLPFTLLWGLLSVFLLPVVHPIVQRLVSALPDILLLPVGLLLIVDFLLTGLILRSTHSTDALRWYR